MTDDASPDPGWTRPTPARRVLLVVAGTASLVLGIAGTVVPLLPTTPFLLLSAACYTRSSKRLHDWLLGHRVLGAYILSYREHKAISRRTKITSVALMWATAAYGILIGFDHWALRALLLAVAVGVTVHLLRMRTATPEMLHAAKRRAEAYVASEPAETV